MFIAMNRFRVRKGREEAFETVWLSRDTYLEAVPGFVEFYLLKGPGGRSYALRLAQCVAEQGCLRGVDQIGGVPRRPCACRQ